MSAQRQSTNIDSTRVGARQVAGRELSVRRSLGRTRWLLKPMQWRQDPIGGLMVGTPENMFQRHLLWPNFAKVGELAQAVIAHSTIPTLKLLIKDPTVPWQMSKTVPWPMSTQCGGSRRGASSNDDLSGFAPIPFVRAVCGCPTVLFCEAS